VRFSFVLFFLGLILFAVILVNTALLRVQYLHREINRLEEELTLSKREATQAIEELEKKKSEVNTASPAEELARMKRRYTPDFCDNDTPSSTLYDEFVRLQNPTNCDSSRLRRCELTARLGLGYQLHQMAACLVEAHRQNFTVVLYPSKLQGYGPECNSEWTCFFKSLSSCEDHSGFNAGSIQPLNTPNEEGYLPKSIPSNLINPGAFMTGAALKYIMRPSDRLQKILDEKVIKADYGMHIRRTDKLYGEAWLHDLEEYVMAIDRIANPSWNFHSAYGRVYDRSIFIATDEPTIYSELSDYPQYTWHHTNVAGLQRESLEATDGLLVEWFSLFETKYFVGTFSSQVSRIVYEIYHTKYVDAYDRAWSLDDPWYGVGHITLTLPGYDNRNRLEDKSC
jgi:glycoprotein 6-alpha-L-fucosyltransferase